jgi:hypothetical protein
LIKSAQANHQTGHPNCRHPVIVIVAAHYHPLAAQIARVEPDRKHLAVSCATTGFPTASSNPTKTSSIIAVRPGTSSAHSHGASCPSDCATGLIGSNQCRLVLVHHAEPARPTDCQLPNHRPTDRRHPERHRIEGAVGAQSKHLSRPSKVTDADMNAIDIQRYDLAVYNPGLT